MRGLALLAALFGACRRVQTGCLGRCCPGTDLSCSSTDWRMDRVFGTCFCDEACQKVKDCCFDYPSTCPAQHCVVSEWSQWSGCSKQCQPALRERRRHVQREPSNGGDACPPLQERAGCLDYLNQQGEHCALERGPAFITSAEYSRGRMQRDLYGAPPNSGYCVEYRMASMSPQCSVEGQPHTRWMQYLREGFTVCVACQPMAMHGPGHVCQGDGSTSDRDEGLQWQAVGDARCRGTWTRVRRLQRCDCPQVHRFVFT